MKKIVFALFFAFASYNFSQKTNIQGHLQPLGSHQDPEGHVQEINGFLEPLTFFREFVNKSKAVLFKGACQRFKATRQWNDNFLRKNYGELMFSVDTSKKETRYKSARKMKLKNFLDIYKKEDLYMIDTIPEEMQKDLEIPKVISSGGFLNRLQDLVLWFSSGGSKSHLHVDTVENINCMISGSKKWFLVDKANSPNIIMDHEEGDYCSVDVDKVDMLKYPFLRKLQWWNATVEEGDCIYVPYMWAHQVSSADRNIAVNFWWTPASHFDVSEYTAQENRSIMDLKFSHAEHYRFLLLQLSNMQKKPIDFEIVNQNVMSEHTGKKIISHEDFSMIDKSGDGRIEPNEINLLTSAELNTIFDGEEPGTINIKGKSMVAENNDQSLGATRDTDSSVKINEEKPKETTSHDTEL